LLGKPMHRSRVPSAIASIGAAIGGRAYGAARQQRGARIAMRQSAVPHERSRAVAVDAKPRSIAQHAAIQQP
jgi:hypothetical protein